MKRGGLCARIVYLSLCPSLWWATLVFLTVVMINVVCVGVCILVCGRGWDLRNIVLRLLWFLAPHAVLDFGGLFVSGMVYPVAVF